MPKIITTIPVKNDEWFVENSIRSAVAWSDYVFVADESSDDGSHIIYKRLESEYNNLKIIYDRPKFDFNTPDMRNYLLNLARSIDGNNIIFEMHADEIMSADILKNEIRDKLINDMPIGSALMMPWVNLWGNSEYYRDDNSVWSNNRSWFAYRDDGKVKFDGPVFHGPRAPESFLENKIDVNYLQVMHYQFLNLTMERSKQALYQIFERNHYPDKNVEYINKIYACAFDVRQVNLSKLEECHCQPWIEKGLSIDKEYSKNGYNWRDTEVLKNFNKNGLKPYKDLNIWFIDWENKRQEALDLGVTCLLTEKIVDPRNLSTKIAHKYLMKYQRYPFWRLDFYKLLVEKMIERVNKKVFK